MAELVELNLEKLVKVFDYLKKSKLYSPTEVNDIIRRFRRYEYGIAKKTKNPRDYYLFIDYISIILDDIEKRRKEKKCIGAYDSIEKPLKKKGASLYQNLCERFKNEQNFQKQINFLLKYQLFGHCSSAYTRFLQFFGSNPRLHEEAGRFEFFQNKSVENARTIFYTALRLFPNDMQLYLALFEVEIGYVKYVRKRIEFLQMDGKKAQSIVSTDKVLNMDIVNLVYQQAIKNLTEQAKIEFLYEAWKLVSIEKEENAKNFANLLYEQYTNAIQTKNT